MLDVFSLRYSYSGQKIVPNTGVFPTYGSTKRKQKAKTRSKKRLLPQHPCLFNLSKAGIPPDCSLEKELPGGRKQRADVCFGTFILRFSKPTHLFFKNKMYFSKKHAEAFQKEFHVFEKTYPTLAEKKAFFLHKHPLNV